MLALVALLLWAAPIAGAEAEIAHLLEVVAQSDCRYERNGVLHSGAQARAHLERKLRHFQPQIASAEDFIALAASRSELTGRPYRVVCEGVAQDSGAWFAAELARYRSAAPPP